MDEYMERIEEYWEIIRAKLATEPVILRYVVAALISVGVVVGIEIPEELAVAIVTLAFGGAAVDSRRKVWPDRSITEGHGDHEDAA